MSPSARPSGRQRRYSGPRKPASPRGASLVGEVIDVEVGPVAHGGFCVARHDGRVVFVRHTLPGERVRASLADCAGEGVEMVDVFRRSDAVAGIVTEMLASLPEARVLWLQLGVGDPMAEARAEAAGVTVVANRCPAIEIRRLGL